jgi:uncharacterized protein (DUF1501 family)
MPSGHRLTRRQFITGAVGAGAVGAVGLTLARHPIESVLSGSGASGSTPRDATLVLCTLYGGNDGLNTVIPYQDGNYLGGRGQLAYQPHEVIALEDGLALHPNLTGLKKLWDAGHLAIVRGVGYPNPSFSHFRSMDIWQTGVAETSVTTGWLGRWLDATGTDPLRAVSAGPNLPVALTGERAQAAAVLPGSMRLPGSAQERSAFAAMEAAARGDAPLQAAVAQSGADMLRVQRTLEPVLEQPRPARVAGSARTSSTSGRGAAGDGAAGAATAAGGRGQLGTQLDIVSRLIKAGVPSKVYAVSLGGFDTHANEKQTQARLLGEVDQAISGFVGDLEHDRRGQGAVVVVYSEFGRRVSANASGGTDHGSAAPVFVAGPLVKGGFYGEEPSLMNLDSGNLRFTTDFRSVYATVLEKVVGVDPKVALGRTFPSLDFV